MASFSCFSSILHLKKPILLRSIIQSCNYCLIQRFSDESDHSPKKPMHPYLRFLHDVLPEFNGVFPNNGYRDKMKMAANLWKSLNVDERKKFLDMYYEDYEKYKLSRLYHDCKMSSQTTVLEEPKNPDPSIKEKRKLRKLRKLNGKPKRAPSPFLLYVSSKRGTFKNVKPASDAILSLLKEFQNLSDEEKMKYKSESEKLREAYKTAISDWEQKMIKLGYTNLLRKKNQFYKDPIDDLKSSH